MKLRLRETTLFLMSISVVRKLMVGLTVLSEEEDDLTSKGTSIAQTESSLRKSPIQLWQRRTTTTFFPEVFQEVENGIVGSYSVDSWKFGSSITINGDGSRVAVGLFERANTNGEVQIYEYMNEIIGWQLIGQIAGAVANEEFGTSISLNEVGNRIAIGAPSSVVSTTSPVGVVYIYDAPSTSYSLTWTLNNSWNKGSENDECGSSVMMSPDGNKFVVGCPGHNSDIGYAAVVDLAQGSPAETSLFDNTYHTQGCRYGTSVSISTTNYAIVGAPGCDSGKGKVTVVSISGTANIRPPIVYSGTDAGAFGSSVSINDSGQFIAGAPEANSERGLVQAFQFDITLSNTADQIGSDITGSSAGEGFGATVSIASTGRSAVGSSVSSGDGFVNIYKILSDNSNWELWDKVQIASVDLGSAVAISIDGTRIALGDSLYEDLGYATVFYDIDPSHMPSSSPSDQPSNLPSDQPSNKPSDQPSDQPSVTPSDQPSNHPSVLPSMDPSDQPSLSQKPSIQPTEQPSLTPSTSPSSNPTSLPTLSLAPSDTPSGIPSSSPTEIRLCFDSIYLSADRDCSWVSQFPESRCPAYSGLSDGKYMFEHCRKTCGKCVCMDDPDWTGGFPWETCTHVSKNPKTRCSNRIPGAKENCIKTCSSATECCKNNPEFRYKNDPKKDCQWVARNPTERRCSRLNVAVNCPIACSRCNYDDYLTPSPTSAPTAAPTLVPSAAPTLVPSAPPTSAPSTAPSLRPSSSSSPSSLSTAPTTASTTTASTTAPITTPLTKTTAPTANSITAWNPTSSPTVAPTLSQAPSPMPMPSPTSAPISSPTSSTENVRDIFAEHDTNIFTHSSNKKREYLELDN